MQSLRLLIKRNRISVIIAVTIAILGTLSQMIYIVYIGELVNRIENREEITSSLVMTLA